MHTAVRLLPAQSITLKIRKQETGMKYFSAESRGQTVSSTNFRLRAYFSIAVKERKTNTSAAMRQTSGAFTPTLLR